MKSKLLTTIALSMLTIIYSGCKLEDNPTNAVTTASLTSTSDGLLNAVNGAYALFKDHEVFQGTTDLNNMYLRQYFQMADFASDDVVCGQVTTDPLFLSFSLNFVPNQQNASYFWYISYKIISDANTVIDQGGKISNPTAAQQQLIGECYFLRAFCHFNLARFFAEPYTINPSAPGIILRTSTTDNPVKARSSVQDTYNQIIADAVQGASLMNQSRGVQYATKEAAWALLSRVYLYKADYTNCINYSNMVINSGKFTESTASQYTSLFANAPSNPETIFCIAFTTLDDYGKLGSIASQYYSDGNSGWGEEYASQPLRDLYAKNPADVRTSYIVDLVDASGAQQYKNGIPIYYVTKFSFQGGSPTLSSPVMFRLSEMYLNRAESEANLSQTAAALTDVDMIRKNRGLTAALYNGVVPAGQTLLNTVLQERRLELAFEADRTFTVYRNKMTMDKTYWGYHLQGLQASDIDLSVAPANYPNMTIPYTSTKIIYYIPQQEILSNSLATQNP
ncbi:RagB/SusD family nutrient uptake outer membrane protein [Mucilaginibacter paludis]|uniref:RagB/SusD domain-containing protein n=1 Tax=Mucilaginibacter paludis DSM 18603 TaxID=714943 RepID=H1Y6S4_9SPHI|nr:RagB/SusD family nutrient uptake outer membrane protein [Mucilaginibacter paludis]EHQ26866.1 RagB/SusD domain-containing protein [Mucilaginibacter paludis DSM 18603]